jgi:hypothetical protein
MELYSDYVQVIPETLSICVSNALSASSECHAVLNL